MPSITGERWPMKVTYFFLSCVGFGVAKTKNDRRVLNISLAIFQLMSIISIYFTTTSLYLSFKRGVVSETIDAAFPLVTSGLTHLKLTIFTLQRTPYERLLKVTDETLWIQWWTESGKIVLQKCEQRALIILFIFVILGHASGVGWVIQPLLLNMKANVNDSKRRHLPSEVIIGIPIYESPNYEILFAFDAFGIYIITILYFCFDYYLVLVNIFIAGQFEILKQRFEEINNFKKVGLMPKNGYDNDSNYPRDCTTTDYSVQEFNSCVKQHQFLISLVDDIEGIYNIMNLVQVLMLSLIICIVGYPLITPGGSQLMLVKNVVFIGSCLVQLFTFTLSCHNIMIASSAIGHGVYHSRWYQQNHTAEGRLFSKNLMIVLMKANYPCYLTGWRFFPITLDTLKSIVTTAFSYLTLMRQSVEST